MCPGDNSARLSVRYLNAQLSAMWQNAAECVGHEGKKTSVDMRSNDYDKHKYTRSLAQFHFAGSKPPRGSIAKDTLFFDGAFGEPRLEFICNHEAALYLKLQKGHFNKNYPSKASVGGYKFNVKDNVKFDGLEVAFRIKFSRSNLSGKDSRIGNGSGHLIQMMILDFTSAHMVLFKSSLPIGTTDSLEWYLRKYLSFLQNAGHHVLFDLPDFDDDQYKPNINYSLATRALEHEELCANVSVHGVDESKINEFLRVTWLNVISKAQGFCGTPPTDRLSGCLTEIKSSWLDESDSHFHIKFNPPRIRALCKHEVILYFSAAEVFFYDSEDFSRKHTHSFENWEFAFIVNVVEDKIGDALNGLKLDLSTARFCQHLSTVVVEEIHIHFTHIITFLEYQYLELLSVYSLLCIYYPGGYRGGDIAPPDQSDISDDDVEWTPIADPSGGKSSGTIVWSETIQKIVLYGFDHMTAVTEESINTLFYSFHKAAIKRGGCIAEWQYEDRFHADFSAIRVKLLSESKVLVTFTIDDGSITLKGKSNKFDFTSWTISYEVDIKMVDQNDLHCNESLLAHFGRLLVGTHDHEKRTTAKHIILDFAHARYVYEHSSMPGLWGGSCLGAVDKFESALEYMRLYLRELSHHGHHIIHTIPIFPHTHKFGLTSASFQVVSKTTVTIKNCMSRHEAPVIMVLGMMCGRPLPPSVILWGSGWVIPGGKSHGTICLSRASFLEGKLLARLELVNARTTVVPRFPRENEEEYKVYLTTWDHHRYRKSKPCSWTLLSNANPGWLEYGWEHRDEWSYEHEGTREQSSGFSVLCHTKNQLCIPTQYRPHSMEIILRGESVLRLKGKDTNENWSKRSSAKWSATIHVYSERTGLRVAITEDIKPVFDKTESEGNWHIDTHKMLEDHLPRLIDIKELVHDLKSIFEGAWEYSFAGLQTYNLGSPVFTKNGDLIVQLRSFTETTKAISSPASGAKSSSRPGLLSRLKSALPGQLANTHSPLKTSDSYLAESFLTTTSANASPLHTPPSALADSHPLIVDAFGQALNAGKVPTDILVSGPKIDLAKETMDSPFDDIDDETPVPAVGF
ncbi:hypothetical protein HGRIS_006999 [Hohenbuehelia grisea]|uniref:Uncharacterized protein n=1 Tax=Hohenbuehelia grisea TaxID=104357 RepID=A0ABR3JAQ4_9AGAR